jgi:hypothetical protein
MNAGASRRACRLRGRTEQKLKHEVLSNRACGDAVCGKPAGAGLGR